MNTLANYAGIPHNVKPRKCQEYIYKEASIIVRLTRRRVKGISQQALPTTATFVVCLAPR